ncbi:HIT domain-containing protein [Streptomyces echinatus]|uniref:HIT domain-containing protein n=1 Tax=Streptomyces echinatus TaxID=67293 RepID=UPI0037A4031D
MRGQVPVSIVHEDDSVTAFIDLQPVTSGHLLILRTAKQPSRRLPSTPGNAYITARRARRDNGVRWRCRPDRHPPCYRNGVEQRVLPAAPDRRLRGNRV